MTTTLPAPSTHTTIGHDAPRIDAVAKVKGEAQFAGDLSKPLLMGGEAPAVH